MRTCAFLSDASRPPRDSTQPSHTRTSYAGSGTQLPAHIVYRRTSRFSVHERAAQIRKRLVNQITLSLKACGRVRNKGGKQMRHSLQERRRFRIISRRSRARRETRLLGRFSNSKYRLVSIAINCTSRMREFVRASSCVEHSSMKPP